VLPSFAVYGSETDCALMVIPRSRSIGLLSSTCASISRSVRPPQSWMMRSASVDLPWSTWAMMEKLRMNRIASCCMEIRLACDGSGVAAGLGEMGADYRTAPPAPRRARAAPGGRVASFRVRVHRDVAGAGAAPDQQHHRLAFADRAQARIQRAGAGHAVAADRQDHVARAQAGLARGDAFDPGDPHALARLQAEPAALLRVQVLGDDAQRIAGADGAGGTGQVVVAAIARARQVFIQLAEGDRDLARRAVAHDVP